MNQVKIARQSKDGYEFYEDENSWRISKDHVINFSSYILKLDKPLLHGFKKTLAIYAEKYSSSHVTHMYQQFQRLVINNNSRNIDTSSILNWKSSLGKEYEWYLGALKGFLLSWYEYGYYGIDKSVVLLLESFKLSGNTKGKAVLMRCPYTGAFTNNEILALMSELNRLWKENLITFETYVYINLLQSTARRPIQFRHLKFKDLRKEMSNNTWNYYLDIPSAKKRNGSFRYSFKTLSITEDLYLILLNFIEYQYEKLLKLVEKSVISAHKMKLPIFIDWHCLKENIENKCFDISLLDKDIFHHSSNSLEYNILKPFCIQQEAISERTGDIIHVNARRFRHTRGTNLGRKGVGAVIIAELLDHSDTQNVKVYTENTADTVQYIDRVMGADMGKLAQAFTGKIISNLSESERGYDPKSFITNDGKSTIGACGTNDFCIKGHEACYLCSKFRPLLDGPHQEILNKLYKEKEERIKTSKNIDYANSKDRIILAVEYVVQACEEIKNTHGVH
ncbi:site-specific integrase [Lonepinella sp. BR2271]|uniref:site-specific integrase n=1 Tax=Lonepinella sp. BR2271 TaxID=3434550 RepID=UPI003F6DC374